MLEAAFGPPAPTSLEFLGQCERFLVWEGASDAVCTSLYQAQNPADPLTAYLLVAECVKIGFANVCSDGWWKYSTLSADGIESDLSAAIFVPGIGTRSSFKLEKPAGAVRVQLYRNSDTLDENGTYELVLSTVASSVFEICNLTGLYRLQTISADGASELSEPLSHTTYAGCIPYQLHDIVGPDALSCLGDVYSSIFTPVGGTSPYTWALASGTLPTGLTLHADSGILDGVPIANGVFTFSVTCTDSTGHTRTESFSISIFGITEYAGLPDANTDTAYSQNLTADGGTPPYSYALTSGALPSGFSMNAAGLITGTAINPEIADFTVTATDSLGVACETPLEIEVLGCPVPDVFPTIAYTTQVSTFHSAFDQSRRVWWLPRTLYSALPPHQMIYRVSTLLPTPAWIANATDSSGLINTAAKGDIGSGMGRCLVDTKYNNFVVFGNQAYFSYYDLDTADCVACGINAGASFGQVLYNDAQKGYDAVRGYMYTTGASYYATGWLQVYDFAPAQRKTIAVYALAGYHTGDSVYVPDTDTVYICNVDGGNLFHKWNASTHAFTYNQGPAPALIAGQVRYFPTEKVLLFRTANRIYLIDPMNGDAVLTNFANTSGTLDYACDDSCAGYAYLVFSSASNPFKLLLTAPYTLSIVTTGQPPVYYNSIQYDSASGLMWGISRAPLLVSHV
jgi:hypothetical protein